MGKEWKKEFARDFIALGSIPFFILVIVRISMLSHLPYLSQFLISAGIFSLSMILLKSNLYAGLGFITLVFTSLFYNNLFYTIFAIAVYAGLICSLFYLKEDKKRIVNGVIFGALSSAISYYIVKLIF